MNLPKLQILMPWNVGGFPVWSVMFQVSMSYLTNYGQKKVHK
jgi:hypothetical protein